MERVGETRDTVVYSFFAVRIAERKRHRGGSGCVGRRRDDTADDHLIEEKLFAHDEVDANAVGGGILARGDVRIGAGFVERANAVRDLIAVERLARLDRNVRGGFDENFAALIDDANGSDDRTGGFDGFFGRRCRRRGWRLRLRGRLKGSLLLQILRIFPRAGACAKWARVRGGVRCKVMRGISRRNRCSLSVSARTSRKECEREEPSQPVAAARFHASFRQTKGSTGTLPARRTLAL